MASLFLGKDGVKLLLKAVKHVCQPTKRGKEVVPHLGGVGKEGHNSLHILAHHGTKLCKVLHIRSLKSVTYTCKSYEREGVESRLCALVTVSISDTHKNIKIAFKVIKILLLGVRARRERDTIALIGRNIVVEHGVKAIH